MNFLKRHSILILLILFAGTMVSFAQQNIRFVEKGSTHALSVPENPDYRYQWSMTWGYTNIPITITDTTNVTRNIVWDKNVYNITVVPVLREGNCYGEPIYMTVYTVEHLSLHAFDDAFWVLQDDTLDADVSRNDFDEMGNTLIYNPTLVNNPKHGTVAMTVWGEFTYIPEPGYLGIDSFQYEVKNSAPSSMYANAWVTIEVRLRDREANLYVEKTGPVKALYGGQISYDILVRNNGPEVARNVILSDKPPFGLFNPQYSTGSSFQTWDGSVSLGDLNVGDSVYINMIADIGENAPTKIYNQALVYSDIFDPDIEDNDSIWPTEISALYVDLPDQLMVPGCQPVVMPNVSGGNNKIVSYRWRPATGLSDTTIATPTFTPDINTIGGSYQYVVIVTDELNNVASDTITLVISDLPVAQIESDTLYRDLGEPMPISGSESTGDHISYVWSTIKGHFVGSQTGDSATVDSLGVYYLTIRDRQKCESIDSVTVLYESHPPVALNDTVSIVAGTDSTVNVLLNDYDINQFNLKVTGIKTPPNHGVFTWDSLGNINFTPDITYWLKDSLEYEVCNDGIPVQCSSAWLIINCLRPPLNADVVLTKTADPIAFWGDSLEYDFSIYSNGPDTVSLVTLNDRLNIGLFNPVYQYSTDNRKTWSAPERWKGSVDLNVPLYPQTQVVFLKITGWVDPRTEVYVTNTAYIEIDPDFIENVPENDTSTVITKIKHQVIAVAGRDRMIGACHDTIELNGNASSGDSITFRWTPSTYLDDPTSSTPTFKPGATGVFNYILTVTDDDGITDSDTLVITVLAPPLADAGDKVFLRVGEYATLDGSKSKGTGLKYFWKTSDGHIVPGSQTSNRPLVDSVGTYILNVTDVAGCTDFDTVRVYRFYYPPYAIPDYYSTLINQTLTGENLIANDFDPNGLFKLTAKPVVNMRTNEGGRVTINSDGSFTYTPATGYLGVDGFTYTVCNPTPDGCARGYVKITVGNLPVECNLSIKKTYASPVVLIGKDIDYVIEVTNSGTKTLTDVTITDSLSAYILNPKYSYDGVFYSNAWTGELKSMKLDAGDSKKIYIRGQVSKSFPDERIINAAMVSSSTFDNCFAWDDKTTRNVDTTSVYIENELIAKAVLIEGFDSNRKDSTIGVCDNKSILSAASSSGTLGIDSYSWSPSEYLTSDSTVTTGFNLSEVSDTTIVFAVIVRKGDKSRIAYVPVHISKRVEVDAGPDQKMNEGVPLVLNATGTGDGVTYTWNEALSYRNDSVFHPIINEPGRYWIYATDKHGCKAQDSILIKVNNLFALNDMLVVVSNTIQTGNIATNDYDPDGDSVSYDSEVYSGPFHGTVVGGEIAANGAYTYKPDKDFTGDDYFTYMVHDNNNPDLYVRGTVFIKVIDVDSVNNPPVANSDVFFVDKNRSVESNLLANDYDYDGGLITLDVSPVDEPHKGTVVFNTDGSFTYTPYSGEVGADSFFYRISDNGMPVKYDTAMVQVYIHKVEGENHKPVAVDDAYYAVVKTITGNVLLNDYDPDGDSITLDPYIVDPATHGNFTFINNYGDFEYVPKEGFEGTDEIVYSIYENGTIDAYRAYATIYITSLAEKRYQTDLVVEKTGPKSILSGNVIQYTITARDLGPTLANNVVVSDTLFAGLSNTQYSTDGGTTWAKWAGSFEVDRMMLYDTAQVLVRGLLPDSIWAGLPDTTLVRLSNTAGVNSHMDELNPDDNLSTWVTTVYQKVIADAGPDTLIGACITDYVLNGSGSIGMGKLTYSWSPTVKLKGATRVDPTYLTSPGSSQRFILTVTSDYNGLFPAESDVDEVWVEVGVSPKANAGDEFWDQTDTVTLDGSASAGEGPLSYLWWTYDKKDQQVIVDSTVTIDVIKSGDYYLTITDRFGCTNTDETHVGFKYDPMVANDDTLETAQQEESICINVLENDYIDPDDEFDLSLLMVTTQPTHGTIIENPGDSCFIYVPDPYFIGYDSFTYIVSTRYSFSDEATVHVKVLPRPAIVPEGFSPNGDGINDFLIIANIEKYELNSLIIFNRWGNVVYRQAPYSNSEPWDGIANKGIRIGSGPVPAGVYLYILDLGDDRINQTVDGKEVNNRIVKGNIYVASDK